MNALKARPPDKYRFLIVLIKDVYIPKKMD